MRLLGRPQQKEKISICYRRKESQDFAGRLADTLSDYFGSEHIYRDLKDPEHAKNFENVINRELSESGALLVVMGEKWISLKDDKGKRKLDDPEDVVVREVASGLQSGTAVLPVLIEDARMPRPEELSDELAELSKLHAISVSHERWKSDVDRLAKVIAIDVPGTKVQRRLDFRKRVASILLLVGGLLATIYYCGELYNNDLNPPDGDSYYRYVSAVSFVLIIVAGIALALSGEAMNVIGRRFAWSLALLAWISAAVTFASFTAIITPMDTLNPDQYQKALIVVFASTMVTTTLLLGLMNFLGFKANE